MQDSAPQQFIRENRLCFIAADDWASYSPDHSPLGLLHFGYPAGFGVRRPSTSVRKSTGPQRGYQSITTRWKEVSIETVRKSIAQCKLKQIKLHNAVKGQNDSAI